MPAIKACIHDGPDKESRGPEARLSRPGRCIRYPRLIDISYPLNQHRPRRWRPPVSQSATLQSSPNRSPHDQQESLPAFRGLRSSDLRQHRTDASTHDITLSLALREMGRPLRTGRRHRRAVACDLPTPVRNTGAPLYRRKHPFIVENKAGAGSNVGTQAVSSPPDGYRLLLITTANAIKLMR